MNDDNKIHRARAAFTAAKESKLIRGPELVMLALWNEHGAGLTPSDIRDLTELPPPLISGIVDKMEDNNDVTRHGQHRDLRSSKLYLTESGLLKAKKLWDGVLKLHNAFSNRRDGWD